MATSPRREEEPALAKAPGATRVTAEVAAAIHAQIRSMNLVSLCFGVLGFAIQAYGYRRGNAENLFDRQGAQTFLGIGAALVIIALGVYARMKGRNVLFGLFGLLSLIGLVALLVQQSRCLHCKRMNAWTLKECPDCGAPAAVGWKPPRIEE